MTGRILFGVAIVMCVACLRADAQPALGAWKTFTDMKNVRAAVIAGGQTWAVTSGGLFGLPASGSGSQRLTNADGLRSNDLRAVAVDGQGRVWMGAADGSVDVFHPSSGSLLSIDAIRQSSRIDKAIQDFSPQGDTMFIVSQFGVSVFNLNKWEFGDTYASFGFPTAPIVKTLVVEGGRIWVGTNMGLAGANLSQPNLSAPSAWTLYGTVHGLPSVNITTLAAFHDTVVVGTSLGAAWFNGSGFQAIPTFNGIGVVDAKAHADSLFVLWNETTGFRLHALAWLGGPAVASAVNDDAQGTDIVSLGTTTVIGTFSRGLAQPVAGGWEYRFPDGPEANSFVGLAVDPDGIVWGASGAANGKGFYRYHPALPEGKQWKNFRRSDHPLMGFDEYYKVSLGTNGSVWVCSWGAGVVEVRGDSVVRRYSPQSQPPLPATDNSAGDTNYTVVGGVLPRPDGANWILVMNATNLNILTLLTDATTGTYHRNLYNSAVRQFFDMVPDAHGTIWFANAIPTFKSGNTGLYFFNEQKLISGTDATGGWGVVTPADGLPNNLVLSVATDLDGDVWVGTDVGMMIITDPLFPRTRRMSSFPVREQSIQAIAVDGINNKWVGTKEGVFVLNADGTQLLQHYNVLSTGGKLVDNDVRTIAIDQGRGIVYFGTEKGLSSFVIPAVRSQRTYTELHLAPNPLVLPDNGMVTIGNLVPNSSVKILNIRGQLMTTFKAQGGGRAFWDGRNTEGHLVGTGVYFVVVFAENGNQVTTGKLAVVRR